MSAAERDINALKKNGKYGRHLLASVAGWLINQGFAIDGLQPDGRVQGAQTPADFSSTTKEGAGGVDSDEVMDGDISDDDDSVVFIESIISEFCPGHIIRCTECGSLSVQPGNSPTALTEPVDDVIDYTVPSNASAASPLRLLRLSEDELIRLKATIRTEYSREDVERMFTVDHRAALNLDDIDIAIRGVHNAPPVHTMTVAPFQSTHGPSVHVSTENSNRWYAVVRGKNFTGVVHGGHIFEGLIKGWRDTQGGRHGSRKEAEFAWLQAYYAGITRIIL